MNIKNKLLVFILLCNATSSIKLHAWRGGGAFVGGALVGTTVALAATSGSRRGDRDPAYYDYKDRQNQRIEIKKEIREYQTEIRNHKKELQKLDLNKNLTEKVRESRRNQHKNAISKLEEKIKDLREDLRNL